MYEKLDEIEELSKKKQLKVLFLLKLNQIHLVVLINFQMIIIYHQNMKNIIHLIIIIKIIIIIMLFPKNQKKTKKKKKKKEDEDNNKDEKFLFNLGGKILNEKDVRKEGDKIIIDLPQQNHQIYVLK